MSQSTKWRPWPGAFSLPTLTAVLIGAVLALPGGFGMALLLGRSDGRFELEPGQVAVVPAGPIGEAQVVLRAGVHRTAAPFAEPEIVDARPTLLLFGSPDDPRGAESLRVRSRNGSIFTLDGLEIHWRVDGERVETAIADGADTGAANQRERVRLLATAAMRAHFGALDSEEVADAQRARAALDDARAELSVSLARHGLELLSVVAPQPEFDREYEHAIEQRKLLEQELERLEAERSSFPKALASMLEKTQANENLAAEVQESALAELSAKQQAAIEQLTAAAEAYANQRRSEAAGERARSEAQAASVAAIGAAEAAALAAEIDAFESHGDMAVREALVERLSKVRFEVAPPQVEVIR
ncbi:MAG: SPFH domain-containing protein [Planctomycetota bacterium]|jgi:hypothetical protein